MIETPRCLIRPVQGGDAVEVMDFYDRNRAHLAPWEPLRDDAFYTLSGTIARIGAQKTAMDGDRALHLLAFGPDGRVLAICNFANITRGAFQACTLGYAVDGATQGRGLMAEVLEATLPHAFGPLGLHRVMANVMPRNTRSRALLERMGFEREGLARDYLRIAGRWEDHILTSRIAPQASDRADRA
ncbi:GNAT family N-acetyltransferase [Pseudooceanicola sp. 502str34]|uniref:GNAT family N-acetyltransferase n=1 Tax=Maritimibacter alkaliphilus TaxID=404236 RepID=UPI001C976D22|nr:GNAT family N-acetyltransferase [Maritimibacter alkaliphilus]MBY6089946.1 GNAT family N-acetyltransferase [Maritimibacter alkaliphilus]